MNARHNGPTRVVHLAARLPVGGMEHIVLSLIRGLPRDRYAASLWCLEDADVLGRDFRAQGGEVLELGKRRRRDVVLFLRIAALIRRQRIAIIHCHDELSWFYGAIGAMLGGAPHILVTMHGRRLNISRRHLWEQRILGRLTTAIVGVSSCLQQQLVSELRVRLSKVWVIQNGIALGPTRPTGDDQRRARARLDLPQDALVVGSVGELSAIKNFGLVIEAAAEARAAVPSLRLVLIGDGPLRERLLRRTAELGLGHTVTFAGLRRDVEELLPALDLYVCSSDYEGVSLSILEAMAAERPVIATAVGGNTEVIDDKETGLLVERGNPIALARAIIELAQDSQRREALGREARRRVQTIYTVDRMLRDYDRLYQTILLDVLRQPGLAQAPAPQTLQDGPGRRRKESP